MTNCTTNTPPCHPGKKEVVACLALLAEAVLLTNSEASSCCLVAAWFSYLRLMLTPNWTLSTQTW